jgi:predicted RecA/RadA family phage recombinase
MKNYIQEGDTLTLAAPYNLLGGQGALVGSIFGVASGDTVIGNNADLVTEGVFNLAKVSAQAVALGAKVYWDDAAKLVTTVAAGNTLIGVCVVAAANPSATVAVRLNGAFQ